MKPAMTRDQWASAKAVGQIELDGAIIPVTLDGCTAPEKHAIAAFNLANEPFGFTREDVRAIEDAINAVEQERLLEDAVEDVAALRSLADRISALLPPEG